MDLPLGESACYQLVNMGVCQPACISAAIPPHFVTILRSLCLQLLRLEVTLPN